MTPNAPAHSPQVLRLADVLALVGYRDKRAFRAWRQRAEAAGFPAPLPGRDRPLVWSRAAVEAWLAGQGQATGGQGSASAPSPPPAPVHQPTPEPTADELAAARARLAARSQH